MKAWEAGVYLTLVEAVGDLHLKYYAQQGGVHNALIGTACYAGLEVILTKALQTNDLSITNGYWDGISNIVNTAVGMSAGEKPSSKQVVGLGLISIGLLLL